MFIYFVTVNFYSSKLIENLYQSIFKNTHLGFQLIIVNNSPKDKDLDNFNQNSEYITIIQSSSNLGFGKACNLALDYIYKVNPQSLVWLINPDTQLDNNAIESVIDCFKKYPDIAILGTQVRNSNHKIWFSHGTFNPYLGSLKHHNHQKNYSNNGIKKIIKCRWVSGCSLVLNLRIFDHCPKFDPNYFLYCEDADFCEQYYQKGYQIGVTKQVLVTHQVSAIIGKDQSFMFENYIFSKLYFMKKNATQLGLLIYLTYLLISLPLVLLLNRTKGIGEVKGLKKFINYRSYS